MIKYFRRIRYNVLETGKTSKYFKYAIGEIVLVVVGILIALQINNWNEGRNQKIKVNNYLKSMLINLNSDTNAYTQSIKGFQKQVETNSKIFNDKNYQEQSIDSIVLIISSYFETYQIIDQTYQKIKNSGLSDDLGSKQLNDAINSYYSGVSTNYNTFLDYDRESCTNDDQFWSLTNEYEINPPYGYSKMNLPFSENETVRKRALIAKIESNMGRNKLRNNIYRKNLGIGIIEKSQEKTDELIKLINEHLNPNSY